MNNPHIVFERLPTNTEYKRQTELNLYYGSSLVLEPNRGMGVSIKLSDDVVTLICKSIGIIYRNEIKIAISVSKDFCIIKLDWTDYKVSVTEDNSYFVLSVEPGVGVTINSKALAGTNVLPMGKYKLTGFDNNYMSATFHHVTDDGVL